MVKNFPIKSVGGEHENRWNLWSNGKVGSYLYFSEGGEYQARITASGTPADGIWPYFQLAIDGEIVAGQFAASLTDKEYIFIFKIVPGTHRVTLQFTNDKLTQKEDRNLYLTALHITPLKTQPQPTLSSEVKFTKQGLKHLLEADSHILEEAEQAIETHRKGKVTVVVQDSRGKAIEGAVVSVKQLNHSFLFGANIFGFNKFSSKKENNLYKKYFADLFNYATTGLYWSSYEPRKGYPKYQQTLEIAGWCNTQGIKLKGHPLLWGHPYGGPIWSETYPAEMLRNNRVKEIVARFKNYISYWDVVNEPSHYPGIEIDAPNRVARKTAANAKLVSNDYGIFYDGNPDFFSLLQKSIRQGVPIDVIGIQAHEPRTMRFTLANVKQKLDRYATLGLPLHITEFTPTSGGQPVTGPYALAGKSTWDETMQAEYATHFYTLCFAHPAVTAISWWDLCDRGAWLEGGGLLDQNLNPKPVYKALYNLIRKSWMTEVNRITNSRGEASFRGFWGRYKVSVKRGKLKTEVHFSLLRNGKSSWVVSCK